MALDRLQRRLQDIYELNIDEDVNDFLITSPDVAKALYSGPAPRAARELLLLREDADGLNLSLYLDAGIVERLSPGDAAVSDVADLDDFCLALEGVSHFLYVVWHAARARSVSLLEMELQAEVDKYVVVRDLLDGETRSTPVPGLIERLFRSVAFHGDLGTAEQRRYRAANHRAERYCRRLEAEYYGTRSRGEVLNELRRFYRLPERGKLLAADGMA